MPTIITRGTLSAVNLGFGNQSPVGGPYWLGVIFNALSGTLTSTNFFSIRTDSSNNMYLGVERLISGYTGRVYYAKIDTDANLLSQTLLSNIDGGERPVAIDNSENWYRLGAGSYTFPSGPELNENITKYNSTNTFVWDSAVFYENSDPNYVVQGSGFTNAWPDSSGNMIVGGSLSLAFSIENGESQSNLVKYNGSNGSIIWQSQYRSEPVDPGLYYAGNSTCFVSNVFSSDNFYGLFAEETTSGIYTVKLCKFNSSGTLLSTIAISESVIGLSERVYDVKCNSLGQVSIIIGRTNGNSTAVLVFDISGNLLWQKWLNGGAFVLTSTCVDSSGNVYIAGRTTPGSSSAMLVGKYDIFGNKVWEKTFSTSTYRLRGGDIVINSDGDICATGQAIFVNGLGVTTVTNLLVMKLPPSGPTNGTYNVGGFSIVVADSTAVDSTPTISVSSGSMIVGPYPYQFGTNPVGTFTASSGTLSSTAL